MAMDIDMPPPLAAKDKTVLLGIFLRLIEAERARFFLWSPVWLAIGIGLYFGWPDEPPLAPAMTLLGASLVLAWVRRHELWPRAMALAFLGFALAGGATGFYGTPMLERPLGPITVAGRINDLEQHGDGERLLLDHVAITNLAPDRTPRRIHLVIEAKSMDKVPQGALAPGAGFKAVASLLPLSEPLVPGGFDFRRSSYFRGIGATGYVLGKMEFTPAAEMAEQGSWTAQLFARWRQKLQAEIHRDLKGDQAGLAIVLLTGDKTALSAATTESMRAVGLAHLLAIAGLHVGLVAGIVFWLTRALFALSERLALFHPIKKWAALIALFAAIFYTGQVGAPVPTERALLMTGGALLGIMFDRLVLSLRLIALAALTILILMPYQLLNPSFQLSFAAVLALIATGEILRQASWPVASAPAGIARRVLRHLGWIVVMSGVATLATLPFSLYHFQEAGLYSMAANALAIPLTAFWLMPCAVFTILLWPLGLAALPLQAMGPGLGLLIQIAATISAWPGAFYEPPQMPLSLLLLASIGGLMLCLLGSRLRWLGLGLFALAILGTFMGARPNLLVSGDGRMVGISSAAHQLTILSDGKPDAFTTDIWEHITGTFAGKAATIDKTGEALTCDQGACLWQGPGAVGSVLWIEDPMAFADACALAPSIIVTPLAPSPCREDHTLVIDGHILRERGALALFAQRNSILLQWVRSPSAAPRPWSAGWIKYEENRDD